MTRSTNLIAAAVVLGIVLVPVAALAQGVGPGSPDEPTIVDFSGDGWEIGQTHVSLDPNGPPWEKHLMNDPGWSNAGGLPAPSVLFTLEENIVIAPALPVIFWGLFI